MDLGAKIILFTDTSPVFKGLALLVLGLAAFLMVKRYKLSKEESFGRKIFTGFTIFIILYGLFILIFRPDWWKLPY